MQDNGKTTPPTKEDAQRTQSRPSPAAVDGRDRTATQVAPAPSAAPADGTPDAAVTPLARTARDRKSVV